VTAWVAESGAGRDDHAALHDRSSEPAMELGSEGLGLPPEDLGEVGRLFVDPLQRTAGVGVGPAGDGCRPGPDVAVCIPSSKSASPLTKAVALYESAGWRRLGS